MFKKILSIAFVATLFATNVSAQSFSNLWKQVDTAYKNDHPQDQLRLLESILRKAKTEKSYGNLLKAELQKISVQAAISPDSLAPNIAQYAANVAKADDVTLGMVYQAILSNVYRNNYLVLEMQQDSALIVSKRYGKQAMRHPQVLASIKAKTYEPLLASGKNSVVFNDDLLHVIGFETEEFETLVSYYNSVGNRKAACLSAYYLTQRDRKDDVRELKKSKYLATIDSLIHVYRDLPEAGELAIEHFNFMEGATDATAQEKIEYIDYALLNWPTWPRMAQLKNARSRITLPSFHAFIEKSLTIPGKKIPVYVTSLTNLNTLNMKVYKVKISGAEEFDPNNISDYKLLRNRISDEEVYTDSRQYYGHPEFASLNDTLHIDPLPIGVYMVEFTTGVEGMNPERILLHISNLRMVGMSLPGNKTRLAVVNATTGKPVVGAKIRIKFNEWKRGREVKDEQTFTTESDGEVVFSSEIAPCEYRISTAEDAAFPWQSMFSARIYASVETKKNVVHSVNTYTDRAIYRPGQTVQASFIAYNEYANDDWKVVANQTIKVTLRDAKGKKVEEKDIVTDEWGVASASFVLPNNGATGQYTLRGTWEKRDVIWHSFRVEEYKRPTFTVEIDRYDRTYAAGDTLVLTGKAMTYAGMPVADATVEYNAVSAPMWWRRFDGGNSINLVMEKTITDANGRFTIKVPARFPEGAVKGNRFASVNMYVKATSLAGESHEATANYPLSDKPQVFSLVNFNQQQCKEKPVEFKFSLLNNAGKEIDAEVKYGFDGSELLCAQANKGVSIDLQSMSCGAHNMKAVCGNDTITQKFFVFSLADTKLAVDTAAWFYSTMGTSDRYVMKEGESETIQFGTSQPHQRVFYAVVNNERILEQGQLELNSEVRTRKLTYDKSWGDGIALRYSWVRNGELYTFSQSVSRPVKDTGLNMEWTTFRDKLTPGQREEWTLKVTNSDGSPAKANVMAVMYDKSLDAIMRHQWSINHPVYYTVPTIDNVAKYYSGLKNVYGEKDFKPMFEPTLSFWHFDMPELPYIHRNILYSMSRANGSTMVLNQSVESKKLAAPMASNASDKFYAEAESAPNTDDNIEEETIVKNVRENLQETAFFMPHILTDAKGNAILKFMLPESVTTWKVMTIAHDKEMNVGNLQSETIAQKMLMIQPNMPRFIREGDKASIRANISNNTAKALSGTATISIENAENGKVVYRESKKFNTMEGQGASVEFALPTNLSSEVYVCKVTANSGKNSDGEQHYLPVLSKLVEMTTTRAFTQTKAGCKEIDLKPLYGKNAQNESLRVEYTNNPVWLMLEALPSVATPNAENAMSLATALYATYINEGLQSLMPNDTTTVKAAPMSSTALSQKLVALQNNNGSFSWFNGMQPSTYVTQAVAKILARAEHIGFKQNAVVLTRAMNYLDDVMQKRIKDMKEYEKTHNSNPYITNDMLDYLYIQAVRGGRLSDIATENAKYLLAQAQRLSTEYTIYGKANMAIVFGSHPTFTDKKKAESLLESIRQYTVKTDEMGRYFDTPKAQYSWCDYKIPTQTAVIEALQTLAPNDNETIADMQQWLLQEKRTQQWNTTLNSAEAINVFFNGWNFSKKDNSALFSLNSSLSTNILVDGKKISGGEMKEGKGYFEKTLSGKHNAFVADKKSDNISWGAVYATYTQPMEDVEKVGESLSVKREIIDEKGNVITTATVGTKVKVRITVEAKRDLDFVEVVDNRAACLEPVNQLSRYGWGYFVAPMNNKTVYYFDKMEKGKHVMETEYYVDRSGTYQSGVVEAKCTYAPEYQAHNKTLSIEVK